MDEQKCCGSCIYHTKDRSMNDWYCTNYESLNGGCFTDYLFGCDDWEERQ